MSWIKIDRNKLESWNINIASALSHIKWINFNTDPIEVLLEESNDEILKILEEPKPRKYNSFGEFLENSGWQIEEKYMTGDDYSFEEFFVILLKKEHSDVNLTAEFICKNESKCEQKILEWANDEI